MVVDRPDSNNEGGYAMARQKKKTSGKRVSNVVSELQVRRQEARSRRKLAKQQAKEARKLLKQAKAVAKRAKLELHALSRKLKKLLSSKSMHAPKSAARPKRRKTERSKP